MSFVLPAWAAKLGAPPPTPRQRHDACAAAGGHTTDNHDDCTRCGLPGEVIRMLAWETRQAR